MSILSRTALAQLPDLVRGRVWLASDPRFDEVRRPWNRAVEQSACAVVEASDADDIARLVQFAHSYGLSVAAQPSGHGATGRAAGAILLRTGRLDSIEVDPVTMTATIGAGVRSGDLQRAAAEHGLTALPGSSPVVTVAGAALGGGLSWFGRSFGWMADGIISADVVTADGTRQHITADTDPSLLWALRGGGGDLAIVTALELRLHPAPELFGGRQLWSAVHAPQITRAYRTMTGTAPDALTLWLELLHFPDSEPMIAIDSTYLGAEEDARSLMQVTDGLPEPLADSRAVMSVAELGTITAEPPDSGPGQSRGELLTHLDDAALSALIDEPIAPLMTVQIRHLQGALSQPSDSPHGPVDEPYALYMFGVPATAGLAEELTLKQADLADTLPTSGRKPITFLNPTETLADALPASAIGRLRTLKEARDPQQTVRGSFSVGE